jgi:hypothetical protein
MDMRFETFNVRSLHRVPSLFTVSKEQSKYKLALVEVQEVQWEGSDAKPARKYTFFYSKGNDNRELGTGFFVHNRIISTIKRFLFISDRIS